MKIIDSHLHLDERYGTALDATKELTLQLENAGVAKAVVLHLQTQPWHPEEFSSALKNSPLLMGFVNIHPNLPEAISDLKKAIKDLGFVGLKLHPRLQEFDVESQKTIELVRAAGSLNIPVLIDAFPDGTHLMQEFSPLKYARLALACPETKIIWAHMGGHYVLDFLMLAKRLPNIYMDISYSLLYYRGSSITTDIIYAMRSLRFEKVFYGSDYPDRCISDSVQLTLEVLSNGGLSGFEIEKIMGLNALNFFNAKKYN